MSQAPVAGVIESVTGRSDWEVAIVLGSGLSSLAETLIGESPIDYSDIAGMPTSTVAGHRGSMYAGEVGGRPTLVFAGRVHLYEGRTPLEVTYPVRAAIGAGCSTIVLTNAAGCVRESLEVGAPCLISDHLNLTGHNPLTGPNDDSVGPRFPDLSHVYDERLRRAAKEVDPSLPEGVYAGLSGPTFETPAEVRMLRTLGADLVGMSTVHEAIVARYLGARVLGISVVSNKAAGVTDEPLSHEEVSAAGQHAASKMERLLSGVIAGL